MVGIFEGKEFPSCSIQEIITHLLQLSWSVWSSLLLQECMEVEFVSINDQTKYNPPPQRRVFNFYTVRLIVE